VVGVERDVVGQRVERLGVDDLAVSVQGGRREDDLERAVWILIGRSPAETGKSLVTISIMR
jgi:hypothetical protein